MLEDLFFVFWVLVIVRLGVLFEVFVVRYRDVYVIKRVEKFFCFLKFFKYFNNFGFCLCFLGYFFMS